MRCPLAECSGSLNEATMTCRRCWRVFKKEADMIEAVQNGVYIATSWIRDDLQELKSAVEDAGLVVTSSWMIPAINGVPYETGNVLTPERRKHAEGDLKDVKRAAVFLYLPVREAGTGHHVEFGYAHALGKPIVGVGEPWSIFHSLAGSWHTSLDGPTGALAQCLSLVGQR